MKQVMARLIGKKLLAPGLFHFILENAFVAGLSYPGQFVHVRCAEGTDPLLRRPFSIFKSDTNTSTFEIVFRVTGKGTGMLSSREPGNLLDVLGPLGNGFSMHEGLRAVALVGGGLGVFPLNFLATRLCCQRIDYFAGFRSAEDAAVTAIMGQVADRLCLWSEDGSCGKQGLVTEGFGRQCLTGVYDRVYACGPDGMMRETARLSAEAGIPCQVSLEERMGCGIGACLACACVISPKECGRMLHVCKDGPVFDANLVYGGKTEK